MRTYGQYCPISRAAEIIGDRWSILILRDLILGTTRFNDLARGLPGLSRGLLSKRLSQMARSGLVARTDDGAYELTEAGADLYGVVWGLGEWGARWTFGEPEEEELDPDLLMWWLHQGIDVDALTGTRFVIHVRFRDHPNQYWVVVAGDEASLCKVDPGFEVDVTLESVRADLYQMWLGRRTVPELLKAGTLVAVGARAKQRALWAALAGGSPMAPVVREVEAARAS